MQWSYPQYITGGLEYTAGNSEYVAEYASHSWSVCFSAAIPLPWASVHWNATGMSLVDPVYIGMPLGDPANSCKVHWNTTGKT